MLDSALLNYIEKQLKRGHSVQEVTGFLMQRGYSNEDINECIQQIYSSAATSSPENKKKSHSLLIVMLILVFVIGALGYFLFFTADKTPEVSLDFTLDFPQTTFSVGDAITFTKNLKNTGERSSMSLRLIYTVKDTSGNIIHTISENLVLTNTISEEVVMTLPNPKAGTYTLQAKANYHGESSTETASFVIESDAQQPEATCFDGVKNQGEEGVDCGGPCKQCIRQCPIFYDDNNDCTNDKCGPETNYIPVYEDIVPCCGNNICESSESKETCEDDCKDPSDDNYFDRNVTPHIEFVDEDIPLTEKIDRIKQLSTTDLDTAAELCSGIVFSYYKDECFYEIAQENNREQLCVQIDEERTADKCYTKISKSTEDSSLCASVVSDLRRDSCYMRFALKGDYTVCSKLIDDYYVQSCNQLKEIGEKAPEIISEYSDDVE